MQKEIKMEGEEMVNLYENNSQCRKIYVVLQLGKLVIPGKLLDIAECFLYPFLFNCCIRGLEENVKLQLSLLVTQKLDW